MHVNVEFIREHLCYFIWINHQEWKKIFLIGIFAVWTKAFFWLAEYSFFRSTRSLSLRKNWVNMSHLMSLALIPTNTHIEESNW